MLKSVCSISAFAAAAGWAYLRHIQLPVGPNRMDWGAKVFGHRGCRIPTIPENTIPAFQYAIDHGSDGIELDVRLTKDNQLVVFHDAICNGHLKDVPKSKRIDELDLFEVKQLSFVCDSSGEVRIPTLEECILFCRENKILMLIEIKELRRPKLCVDKVLEMFAKYPDYLYTQSTVIAFSPFVCYDVRLKNRRVAVGQLYSEELITTWVNSGIEKVPWFLKYGTSFYDWLFRMIQSKLNPWVAGVSMVCPKFPLYSVPMKKMWHSRRIGVYLWGFQSPQECTEEMRTQGVLVACDDLHEEFRTARPPPDFDIFGDEARERQRREEEAAKAKRLSQ